MAESGLGFFVVVSSCALNMWRPVSCGLAVGVSVTADPKAVLDTSYSESGVSRVVSVGLNVAFCRNVVNDVVVDIVIIGGIGDCVCGDPSGVGLPLGVEHSTSIISSSCKIKNKRI